MNSLKALTAAALVVAAPAIANAKQFAPRTPESIACSQQADAKNLHGKPRVSFRRDCLKTAHKTGAVAPAATQAAAPAPAAAPKTADAAPATTPATHKKTKKAAAAVKTPAAPKTTAQ